VLLAEINLHPSKKSEIGLRLLNVGIEEVSRFLIACSKSAATVRSRPIPCCGSQFATDRKPQGSRQALTETALRPSAVNCRRSNLFHKDVSHFAHLCRRCRNIVLTEPVQTDKCVNRSQVPFVRRLVGGDP
jgi:hypothetical protein